MCTFGPKLEYLVYILMFAYSMCTNNKLYICKLHSDFCKGYFTCVNSRLHDHGLIAIDRQISHNYCKSFGKPSSLLLYNSATSSNKPFMTRLSMFAYFTHVHKNSCKVLIAHLISSIIRKLKNFYTSTKSFTMLHSVMYKLCDFKVPTSIDV